MEIKGCKAFTKEVRDDEDCVTTLEKVRQNLEDEYSALDWNYMSDREYGELFCDIGFTYHPQSNQPLVGLWKLDSLEASYGAGGYLNGNIHNINTLGLYGALQAEMASERSKRTHISFRSTYNLAYEATRRKNNARDLFKEKEVYKLDENFAYESERILFIYESNVVEKSYGVRDEIRVGYEALTGLQDIGLDDEVRTLSILLNQASE